MRNAPGYYLLRHLLVDRQRTLYQGDSLAQYRYVSGKDAIDIFFQREQLLTAEHQTLQSLRVNLNSGLVGACYLQRRLPLVFLIFKMFILYHVAKINIFLFRSIKIPSDTDRKLINVHDVLVVEHLGDTHSCEYNHATVTNLEQSVQAYWVIIQIF